MMTEEKKNGCSRNIRINEDVEILKYYFIQKRVDALMSQPRSLQNRFDNLSDREIAEIVVKELENAEIEYSFSGGGVNWIENSEPVWAVSWHNFYEGSHCEIFNNKEAALECYRHRYKRVDSIHLEETYIFSEFNLKRVFQEVKEIPDVNE